MMERKIKILILIFLPFLLILPIAKSESVVGETTTIPFYPNQRAICKDSSGNLHVVWLYNYTAIYYAKSSDGGISWNVNTSFYGGTSSPTSTKATPSISCDGNNITIAYEDVTADNLIIAISEDNGATWNFKVPRTSCVDSNVVVERRGQRIYVVYQTPAQEECGDRDIRFFNSSDGGNTWGSDIIIFNGFYS